MTRPERPAAQEDSSPAPFPKDPRPGCSATPAPAPQGPQRLDRMSSVCFYDDCDDCDDPMCGCACHGYIDDDWRDT